MNQHEENETEEQEPKNRLTPEEQEALKKAMEDALKQGNLL